jgi:hypothetical protein
VIVAVSAMREVQVVPHQIVDMVTMENTFMTAIRTVDMSGFVSATVMLWGTTRLICAARRDLVHINMVAVDVIQVPLMQIISMPVMLDGGVAAIRSVGVCRNFAWSSFSHTGTSLFHLRISPSSRNMGVRRGYSSDAAHAIE